MTGSSGAWARPAAVSALALTLATAWPLIAVRAQSPAAAPDAATVLPLNEALARAAAADPGLAGAEARARAGEAGVRQADVRPNPALGLVVENLPTIGGAGILDRTETTLSYEQRFERGGDRPARVELARAEVALTRAEANVRRLDRLEQVQLAWADALAAGAELETARARLAFAERFKAEVQRRVDMARDPLFAGARADAELAQAQIDFDQAEIAARLARAVLARFWSGSSTFAVNPSDFVDTGAARAVAGAAAGIDFAAFEAQRDIARARVRVEQARARPDATVSVGVRHVWEGQDLGLVVGGSIPLGRYDRNQGAIDRAQAEGLAAEADLAALRQSREREIARLQVVLASGAMEARRVAEEVLPQARRAVTLVREGFARGGFTYNDVAAAQAALLQAEARRVAVLRQFHSDRARLDRLTGAHADLLGLEIRP
jgi:outer membrane protein, heavy metal efflux system